MLRWLAFAHPAWMALSIALALLALRVGLGLRRARRLRRPGAGELRRRHLRLARPAVALLLVGFALGPLSAVWLRDWEPLRSFHGGVGLTAALLFAATAAVGRAVEKGRVGAREAHGILALLGILAAAIAAVAGLVLLP